MPPSASSWPSYVVAAALAVEAPADAVGERPERVVADDQVGAVLDGDVDVGGAPHAAVDVVDALDARRLVEARQRRRRLHRFRDRHRGVLVVAEDDALGGVEVHRADVELALGARGSSVRKSLVSPARSRLRRM